jgi:hypothetical protein
MQVILPFILSRLILDHFSMASRLSRLDLSLISRSFLDEGTLSLNKKGGDMIAAFLTKNIN